MDYIKQWALTLIAAAAVSTLVLFLAPSGNAEKSVRAVVGIFVVAAVCSPLADMAAETRSEPVFSFEGDYSYDNRAVYELYEEQVEKAIGLQLEQAAEDCKIRITEIQTKASIDEEGCIIIHNITVGIDAKNSAQAEEFGRYAAEVLGVPVTARIQTGKDES